MLYQSAPGVSDVVWQNDAVFRQYLRLDLETTSTTITGSVPSVTPPPATELEYHYRNQLTLYNSAVVRDALVTNVLYSPSATDRNSYVDDPEEINAFIAELPLRCSPQKTQQNQASVYEARCSIYWLIYQDCIISLTVSSPDSNQEH